MISYRPVARREDLVVAAKGRGERRRRREGSSLQRSLDLNALFKIGKWTHLGNLR
jgi:hypothetical protein